MDDDRIQTEDEVTGMPASTNSSGKGYVDYVPGSNHKPIAIVEAKRSMLDPELGRQQAKLYADCLEQQWTATFIYYSNGYETRFWDDQYENPRDVVGFHRQDRLERIIWRHQNAQPLSVIKINAEITNRDYQSKRLPVSVKSSPRIVKNLIHIATHGKTRDGLLWIIWSEPTSRRVLFLADQRLVTKQVEPSACPRSNKHATLGSGDHRTSKLFSRLTKR